MVPVETNIARNTIFRMQTSLAVDQQMASQVVTQETAPPDITLEIVSPKLYTAKLVCILKIVI
jgi:hypothetical protein